MKQGSWCSWIVPTLLGGILYFAGGLLPHWSILIPVGWFFLQWIRVPEFELADDLLLVFVTTAFLVTAMSIGRIEAMNQMQPLLLPLVLMTALAGRKVDLKVLCVLLALSVFEVFWTGTQGLMRLDLGRGLYDSRPEGFGGAGRVGERIFLAFLILYLVRSILPRRYIALVGAALLAGAIFNITRSVFIGLLPLVILTMLQSRAVRKAARFRVLWVLGSSAILVCYAFRGELFQLFFREQAFELGIVLSGRDKLWEAAWLAFEEAPLLGMKGLRWNSTAYSLIDAPPNNAHNSFLDVIVSYGMLGFIWISSLLVRVNRKNAGILFSILVFSFFNKSIFWNVSLFDLLMYCFIAGRIYAEEGLETSVAKASKESEISMGERGHDPRLQESC